MKAVLFTKYGLSDVLLTIDEEQSIDGVKVVDVW